MITRINEYETKRYSDSARTILQHCSQSGAKDKAETLTIPEAIKLLRIGINQTYRSPRGWMTGKHLAPKWSVVAFLAENNPWQVLYRLTLFL